ncbi:MAG: ROK family protein [Acidobacteria bacterium]|nr:ROK family protein [Acidobacteriota bacterium]
MSFIKPKIAAPLDPDFMPAALRNRHYIKTAKSSGASEPLIIGLERENGLFSRHETIVQSSANADTLQYADRVVKFLLWSRGAWRIWLGGSAVVGEYIRQCYADTGSRRFDVDLMMKVYERPFEVKVTDTRFVPGCRERNARLGGHLDGCRIGFDLGASDFKVAAVKDGDVVYSEEFPWNPRDQPDPEYHYRHLTAGIKHAAERLPRVDAIGGSSAGVIVDNKIMVASLFRAIPASRSDQAKNTFLRIRDEWGVPLEAANDGDVTALAGAMSIKANGMLGIAMGSSEAAGYINPQGFMTGWLSELAFAPVDYNASAALDEWSGDYGVGGLYFSQQAVNKLLPASGIRLPEELDLPERLKEVQSLMAGGDPRAAKIYETIGVYLGYTIPHYADFYDFSHMLVLGRVTTGAGGELAIEKAREVLKAEFPELAEKITLYVPDEKSRRVGQAVAAASLPSLK